MISEKELLKIVNKKQGRFSKWIVSLVIFLNILFTTGVFIAALKGATIPDALIIAWFGFTTGELWMLASIRKKKEVNNGQD